MAMTRESSPLPVPDSELGSEPLTLEDPMGSLYEVTRLRNIRSNRSKMTRPQPASQDELDDFISRGIIAEAEAEELYEIFHTSLNHYLWVGLEQTHPSFISVRKSSELLTATILAVTALHIPTSAATFDVCYKEFLSLISSSMFSRYHSIDDVRGLCIAAFWLSEVSWKLSGHAIRIATELNLHQSFARALEGDREHFLRARLWYMLYVCDHHFSIAYGRPPMIAESIQIRQHELFLESPFANALDARLLSQVNLMQILTRVHVGSSDVEGSNGDTTATMLTESDLEGLRRLNLEIDKWRIRWHARQTQNFCIGSFPPLGIILYSYFAKLQVNSLAVRGVSMVASTLSTERKEFANMAVSAAISIITFVLEEDDMRRALVGTPLYVHTMIAFASVFLMKVATRWNSLMGLKLEEAYVSSLLKKMIEALKNAVTSDRHVLKHIAAGLEKMLNKMGEAKRPGQRLDDPGPAQEDAKKSTGDVHIPNHEDDPSATAGSWPSCFRASAGDQLLTPATWTEPHVPSTNNQFEDEGCFNDGLTFMNDSLIFEAFGTGSANDVYNLLSSQFSF
ncbi:hypothetical protein SGCOL_006444 [Colletotrichum sp. CLE4]